MSPSWRMPGISSFRRLIERRNVDFPQPDGPISAVTARGGTARLISNERLLLPVPERELLALRSCRSVERRRRSTGVARALTAVIRTVP